MLPHLPMLPRKTSALVLALALGLLGCGPAPPAETADRTQEPPTPQDGPQLGLMTSLPLYWPLGAGIGSFASGSAELPWQRREFEKHYSLVPLDTLSPFPGLDADAPETDPLERLERLAVIQPRGLSPSDNVALDDWVRGGGHLLLVLDPMLTGDYDLALGDPRRPTDRALIPPVVARWGLKMDFDDEQAFEISAVSMGEGAVLRAMAGEIALQPGGGTDCAIAGDGLVAQCRVGEGRVTLLADAASFEHLPDDLQAGAAGADAIATLFAYAFGEDNE